MPRDKRGGPAGLVSRSVRPQRGGQQQANGFPDTEAVDLVYYGRHDCDYAGIANFDQTYRLGSLFDPDFTGGGHQPRYFDRYAAVYNYYRVDAVTITARARVVQDNQPTTLTLVPTVTSGTLTSENSPAELPRAVLAEKVASLTQEARVHTKVDLHAVQGRTRAEYKADDLYSASVSTSPARGTYLHILLNTMNGLTSTSEVALDIKLIYHCVFFDRATEGVNLIVGPVPAGAATAALAGAGDGFLVPSMVGPAASAAAAASAGGAAREAAPPGGVAGTRVPPSSSALGARSRG